MRVDRCFAFVDICNFSAFTDANGDEAAVALLAGMRAVVRRAAERRGVRVIKWLGDGAMLSAVERGAVAACVLEVRHHLREVSPLPLRIGICRGDVIMFEGDDYVGACINVASRLCQAARPDGILMGSHPDATIPRWAVRDRRPSIHVHGIPGELEVEEVHMRRVPGVTPEPDPVCGLRLDPGSAQRIPGDPPDGPVFCSDDCADAYRRAREQGRAPVVPVAVPSTGVAIRVDGQPPAVPGSGWPRTVRSATPRAT